MSEGERIERRSVGWLAAIGLAYAAYFVLRFGGLWSENDTGVFSNVTRSMLRAGSIFFPGQYVHGYGYPAWLGSLSLLTGLSPTVVNTVVAPYVGVLVLVTLGYLVYREVIGAPRVAAVAMLLLFGAPDLLFGVLRGNHEKLTIGLTLLALFAILRGFQAMGRSRGWQYAAWALVAYLAIFTNATVNDYFASTFTVATGLAMVGGSWILRRQGRAQARRVDPQVFRRLAIVVLASWLVIWWVMFFVFTPAGHDFALLKTAGAKLLSLFATFHTGSNPYVLAKSQWDGKVADVLVASYRWVLFGTSFVAWIVWLWLIVVRRRRTSWQKVFLLMLFGAFGLTVAIAIPMDFTGLAAGANLEVRNFTYFSLLAAPVAAWGWSNGPLRKVTAWIGRRKILSQGVIPTLLGAFLLVSLLKVTLDPSISNQWSFYRPSERQAVAFFWTKARGSTLWTGPDNRIPDMWNGWASNNADGNGVVGYTLTGADRDWLRSPVVVASSIAERSTIPNYRAQDRVYDNGTSQIYHVRPLTPFQN